jgi:hypothetical protein
VIFVSFFGFDCAHVNRGCVLDHLSDDGVRDRRPIWFRPSLTCSGSKASEPPSPVPCYWAARDMELCAQKGRGPPVAFKFCSRGGLAEGPCGLCPGGPLGGGGRGHRGMGASNRCASASVW